MSVRYFEPVLGKPLSHVVCTSVSILLLGLLTYGCFKRRQHPSVPQLLRVACPWLILSACFWAYVMGQAEENHFAVPRVPEMVIIGAATTSLAVIFLLYASPSTSVLMHKLEGERRSSSADSKNRRLIVALHWSLNFLGVFLVLASPNSPLSAYFSLHYLFAAPPLMGITLYMTAKRSIFDSRGAVAVLLISTMQLIPGWCAAFFGVDRLLYPLPTE